MADPALKERMVRSDRRSLKNGTTESIPSINFANDTSSGRTSKIIFLLGVDWHSRAKAGSAMQRSPRYNGAATRIGDSSGNDSEAGCGRRTQEYQRTSNLYWSFLMSSKTPSNFKLCLSNFWVQAEGRFPQAPRRG